MTSQSTRGQIIPSSLSAAVAISLLLLVGAPQMHAQTFGGFKSGISYANINAGGSTPTAANQVSVATGHFRGANKPLDLAVADAANETVEIWFGNGDGTFQRPASAEIYSLPPLTSIYSSAPNPSVEPTVITSTGNTEIAAGDLSGTASGVADIVLANFQGPGTVTLLRNNRDGTGTFTASLVPSEVNNGSYVTNQGGSIAIAIGDFNNDGYADLAIGNANGNYATPANATSTIGIVFNNCGNGGAYNFCAPVSYNAGIQTIGIAAVSLQGASGFEDLVATDGANVYVLLNQKVAGNATSGNFPSTPSETMQVNGNTIQAISGLITADVNNDGSPDVIVEDQFGDNAVLLNNGSGTLGMPSQSLPDNFAAVAGAFNSSSPGNPGLVLLASGGMEFLPNNAGTFGTPVVIGPFSQQFGTGAALAAGAFDSNNNTNLGVVAVAGSEIHVLLGNGDGTFHTAPSYLESVADPAEITANASSSITAVAAGNLHGNGQMDVVTADVGAADTYHPNAISAIIVRLANSDGTLPASGATTIFQTLASNANFDSIVLGNFGGAGVGSNGSLDIAAITTMGGIYIFQNDGTGHFTETGSSPILTGFSLAAAVAGDFRAHGGAPTDIAAAGPVTNANNFNIPQSGSIVVLLGNGDGTFVSNGGGGYGTQYQGTVNSSGSVTTFVNPAQLAVGSLGGSKYPDIVVADSGETYPTTAGGGVWVLKNDGTGDGGFNSAPLQISSTSAQCCGSRTAGPSSVALGKIFGSSVPDIVAASSSGIDQFLEVFQNNGTYTFPLTPAATLSVGGQVTIADVNQDTRPDVVLLSDVVQVLLNTGNASAILSSQDPAYTAGPGPSLSSSGPQPVLLGVGYLAASPTAPNVLVGDAQPAVDVLLNAQAGSGSGSGGGGGGSSGITASANPASLSFGVQIDGVGGTVLGSPIPPVTGPAQAVTLTNTSASSQLTNIVPTVTGTNAGDFTLTGTCGTASSPGTLNAGASCTINVAFAPSVPASAGPEAESATLSIADNATGAPQTVSLSGEGAPFVLAGGLNIQTTSNGTDYTGTFDVTLAPGTGSLALSCAPAQSLIAQLPAGTTCSVNPSSISQTNTTQTVAVAVTIMIPAEVVPNGKGKELPPAVRRWVPVSLLAAILLLTLWMSLAAADARRARAAWLLLGLVVLCGAWMEACGKSSTPSGPTPGPYTFVVTGKLGNVTQTTNVTVNVQ